VKVQDGATVAYPRELPGVPDVAAEIGRAMTAPIGSPPSREVASGRRDVVVVNDITRPVPSRDMLAAILSELEGAGIPRIGGDGSLHPSASPPCPLRTER
jgi:hypothetical protein